jgi:hypothetical protein
VSTLRPKAETTCIILAGEHPFIKHNSYVHYGGARKVRAADLAEAVKKRLLKPHQAASHAFLEKVRAGAKASPFHLIQARLYRV